MAYVIRRTDHNQTQIVTTLRNLGCKVFITSTLGRGFPDIVVSHPLIPDWLKLFEIKDGTQPESRRRLTKWEAKFASEWPSHVILVQSVKEAENIVMEALKCKSKIGTS